MADSSIHWEEESSRTNKCDRDTDRNESLVILSVQTLLIVCGLAYSLACANPCVSVCDVRARKKASIVALAVVASQELAHVKSSCGSYN